jgi:hypothetical protein
MNISDILNVDLKKRVREDERFKKYFEQLNEAQKEHVEKFIDEIKDVFMPSVESFGEAYGSMTDEEREEFNENLKKLNT